MVHSYSGDDINRLRRLGEAYETAVGDVHGSSARAYQINTLGFRGGELDLSARPRIFAFGCSHTFGTGLSFEETWPAQLTRMLAERRGIAPDQVGLMNFGEGGASNDHIVRMILTQCAALRPDLVIVLFTTDHRLEAFADYKPFKVGDWVVYRRFERWLRLSLPGLLGLEHHRWAATHYYRLRSPGDILMNALKNLLLAQAFCAERAIPYLASWLDYRKLEREDLGHDAVFAPLIGQLDRRRLVDFSIHDGACDLAADGAHLGPRSHLELARRMAAVFEREQGAEFDRLLRMARGG